MMASAFPSGILDDLRSAIARGQAILVVGAGVTIAATGDPTSSWTGLIQSAVRHCVDAGLADAATARGLRETLSAGEAEQLLDVATQVTELSGHWSRAMRLCWKL